MSAPGKDGRPLLGYCDRLTYRQGERLDVRASGEGPVEVSLVRLNHPPDDPNWPVPMTSPVDAVPVLQATAAPQPVYPGSYLHVADTGSLASARSVTVSLFALPTRLSSGHPQALISTIKPAASGGFALVIEADGTLAAYWGRNAGPAGRLHSPVPLLPGYWHVVSAAFDEADGSVALTHRTVAAVPGALGRWTGSARDAGLRLSGEPALLIGAGRLPDCAPADRLPGRPGIRTSFNGKIEQPVVAAGAVPPQRLDSLRPGDLAAESGQVLGAWDFALDQSAATVADVSGNSRHGVLVNQPARAVTGVRWEHDVQDWTRAAEEYAAVHFHDDDLDDCRWPAIATVRLPDDLPAGVYGIRLAEPGGAAEDLIPVIVTPAAAADGQAGQLGDVLIVLPSFTYIAYANGTGRGDDIDYVASGLAAAVPPPRPEHQRLEELPEIGGSLYDVHSDGSGWMYSTPRRPLLTCRPDWKSSWRDAYRHLGADLYLMSWLDLLGISYDVVTDHTVHEQGADLLARYAACLTGSHPEYISRRELDAFSGYLDRGGCLFYLGGNGFYWVTAESESIPEMVEVRRGFAGTRTWSSAPGECYHSLTGELGGLWKHRGLPPNLLTGVGMAAQGADGGGSAYRRTEASHHGPAAFLFDGVDAEKIGASGFDMGAAAADEVDRFDPANGSPPWAIVAASARDLSQFYKLAIEEIQITRENTGGDHEPGVRADLVYLDQESGGFVFSVGSIAWIQSMAVGYFDSDTARVTENALRRALKHGRR